MVKMKIRMEGRILGLSGKDYVLRLGLFFESVLDVQFPLKAWNHLTTKGFLNELNNIAPTNQNTHTHSQIYILYNQDEERLNTQDTRP
jgi:hypothetical protein